MFSACLPAPSSHLSVLPRPPRPHCLHVAVTPALTMAHIRVRAETREIDQTHADACRGRSRHHSSAMSPSRRALPFHFPRASLPFRYTPSFRFSSPPLHAPAHHARRHAPSCSRDRIYVCRNICATRDLLIIQDHLVCPWFNSTAQRRAAMHVHLHANVVCSSKQRQAM